MTSNISRMVAIMVASLVVMSQVQAEPIFPFKPDLVVLEVSSPNLDSGIIRVRVKNQGLASSASCYMAIRVTPFGGSMKVFSPAVPPLAAGQVVYVEAHTGFGLSQADYQAIVDRSDTVKESNEANNVLAGKFGGKP